ncbi:MAG TPA: cytosolic protein [Phycisphaerales bacterium]|nr:cytosolic protein [Phycisphaerales bacterium]
MEKLNIGDINDFVNKNISIFHQSKLSSLQSINLKGVLNKKNPYLFKAKNITVAADLVTSILDAFLSSSEEKLFGDFLEELAIFISSKTCNGRKSAATGIDLEFVSKGTHYLVSVKSGPNWGNSSQQEKQERDFQIAVKVLKQSNRMLNVQPVLGICYGKVKTSYLRGYLKVVGQNFWYLISEDENLYTDIIEPLGYRAKQHNAKFMKQKSKIINLFTQEFLADFCDDGLINWKKLVEFNSGNLDLKKSGEKQK